MYTPQQHASEKAKQWLLRQPLFFDTETTRFDGEIVDLAIVDHEGKVLLSTLVRACEPISEGAGAVHHITDEMLADAPTFDAVWAEFKRMTTGKLVVIYNKKFDLRMLQLSALAYPEIKQEVVDWTTIPFSYYLTPTTEPNHRPSFVCAMELYAAYRGIPNSRARGYKWWKLDEAMKQCGIECDEQVHRAASDAELTRLLVYYMAEQV